MVQLQFRVLYLLQFLINKNTRTIYFIHTAADEIIK